jgi:hypothetical protein
MPVEQHHREARAVENGNLRLAACGNAGAVARSACCELAIGDAEHQ